MSNMTRGTGLSKGIVARNAESDAERAARLQKRRDARLAARAATEIEQPEIKGAAPTTRGEKAGKAAAAASGQASAHAATESVTPGQYLPPKPMSGTQSSYGSGEPEGSSSGGEGGGMGGMMGGMGGMGDMMGGMGGGGGGGEGGGGGGMGMMSGMSSAIGRDTAAIDDTKDQALDALMASDADMEAHQSVIAADTGTSGRAQELLRKKRI